jgi:hypothetical protein
MHFFKDSSITAVVAAFVTLLAGFAGSALLSSKSRDS